MKNIKDIVQTFKEKNINVYEVELPTDVIDKGVRFFGLDAYMHYLLEEDVSVVFKTEFYSDKEEHLITDELIKMEFEKFGEGCSNTIINQIKEYNSVIENINFDNAMYTILANVKEGIFCYVYLTNDELYGVELLSSKEKIKQIIVNNEEEIYRIKNENYKRTENLKKKLKNIIINDKEFKLCTNKQMRINYMRELVWHKLGDEFEVLKQQWKSNTTLGVYWDAINFAELIWREIKAK